MNNDFISINEACELLGISRPTLYKYRDDYQLSEIRIRSRVFYSKLEIIEKIIYSQPSTNNIETVVTAVCFDKNLKSIFLRDDIIDLRSNLSFDAFAIISLLCKLKDLVKNKNKSIYLLVEDTPFCRYLKKLGFFNELEKGNPDKVFFRKKIISDDSSALKGSVILPLHLLGYRGAEKRVLDELYDALLAQGFSEELSGYLGWAIGELSDNCHTHSRGGPCYLMIESKHSEQIRSKFLSFVIGDVGIGIQNSLKTNDKYKDLPDHKALVYAFLSDVSSWPDEHKRGKGLNDILGIAIGNEAWLRCESSNLSLFASSDQNIKLTESITDASGTRIGLILIDNTFKHISRSEVNKILNILLEKL